jgi:hypothetical protein
MQSELLTQFYQAYAGWLDAGAPEGIIFSRQRGLCWSAVEWISATGKTGTDALLEEMDHQFVAAGLDPTFPFNNGSVQQFGREKVTNSKHLNEQRIQWVREHAATSTTV